MKKSQVIVIYIIVFLTIQFKLFPQSHSSVGLWKFDDNMDLAKAEIGSRLELIGVQLPINGPEAGNGAVRIGKGSYYKMNHGIASNGGGNMVNEYSLQIDFRIPSLGRWYSLFQTSITNANDAECFINGDGYIGVQATSYSKSSVKPNEWYRLVISVKNGTQFKFYLEGQLFYNGFIQTIDGRFALDNLLLLFADDNGEDGEIDCAEIAIWNYALTSNEIKSLGEYGHAPKQLALVPYLQTPTDNSIHVCWHDPLSTITKVEYGTTPSLGHTATGMSEIIFDPYRWHTVKLSSLQPNTEYYYKVMSGSGTSAIYSFRTQPPEGYTGKVRFLLLSDTHTNDTTIAVNVIREAKKKMQELYGPDYYNKVNLVLHSGDLVVSGNEISQWTDQYFAPMSQISPNIPFVTVTGNHEVESWLYYSYMKYDEVSAFPAGSLKEKFWSLTLANTVIIGLNSNMTNSEWAQQNTWLNQKLGEIQADAKIDFVLLIVHHLPISELWGEGISDAGSVYVKNQIIPILKKYSKVVQLSYGHTHGFERGTVESEVTNSNGDFRIVCGGGGGGPTDRWGAFKNADFSSIHISLDDYFYQLIEVDVANKSFESSMYSLGNSSKSRNSELMDRWYKKLNQYPPERPIASNPTFSGNNIIFNTSQISADSLMTVRIKVATDDKFNSTIIDTMIHWKNIYGVDASNNPIDLNKGLDLTKIHFNRSLFVNGRMQYYKVQYRDHNLKWSSWSNIVPFDVPQHIEGDSIPDEYVLRQNFPNPFNPLTNIIYSLPKNGFITLKIYDILGNEIATLVNEEQSAGQHQVIFDGSNLSSGVYFYKIQTEEFAQTKKLILVR